MCFSTTASFVSGIVLTVIGIASVKKANRSNQVLFACIPFLFAVQQFSEGFVWLALLNTYALLWLQLATYLFLIFALAIWPAWVPYSLFLMEKNKLRRKLLAALAVLGTTLGLFSIYYLIAYPSEASLTSYHIHYELHIPYNAATFLGLLYLLPTIVSNFISSQRGVALMGACIALSYLISKFFFQDNVLSIWCFFSAAISITIYVILARKQEEEQRVF